MLLNLQYEFYLRFIEIHGFLMPFSTPPICKHEKKSDGKYIIVVREMETQAHYKAEEKRNQRLNKFSDDGKKRGIDGK